MALLSMVMLIGSSAFSIFSQRWDGQLGKFDKTMQKARDLMLVQEVLDSLIPYMAYDEHDNPAIYFEGNRNGFVAVSSKSVYSSQHFALVRFSVRQKSDLKYQIIYEEWPMAGEVLRSVNQKINFSSPLILFDSVSNPSFSYFGWKRDMVESDDGEMALPARAEWMQAYNALEIGLSPLNARLRFTDDQGGYEIKADLAVEKPALLGGYSGIFKKYNSEKAPTEDISGNSEDECYC
jgi:hypothetical protein